VSEEKEIFTLAPKATEADSIILNIAHQNEALVITNDFYEDYSQSLPEAHQWFTEHHITIARAMDVWTLNTTPENMFME
jgi:predicted nuclease of predicted toxin-antitoxin system